MTKKEEFINLYQTNITREGGDKLLEYLDSPQSDFFTAPASTRFHGAFGTFVKRIPLPVRLFVAGSGKEHL